MDEIKTPSPSPADAQLHFLDYWRVIRIRKAIIITVFLITAIIATAVTFILPEAYSSICRIKVEQDVSNVPGLNSGTTETGGGFDPYFIQTTFEIMQSEVVLSNVIATLDLNEKWGKKFNNGETLKTSETMLILKNNMLLTPVRNTKLITITIYSDDPKEAAQIANAEAASYTQYRLRTREQLALTGLDALQEQYDQEAQEIGVAQSNVDELRKNLGIVDQPGSEQYTEPINEDAMRQLDTQRISCEREYSEASSQLNDLNAYSTKQLRDVLPSLYPDTQLQSLLDKLHESEQDFAVSTNDYSLTNVDVLRIQSAIDTLNQQVDNRVVGLMAGIKSRVDAAKAALDDITRQVDEAKTTTLADSTKNQPYYDAKRNLQQLTELHRLLYLKMDSEKVDAKIPQDSMVSVVDPAEPGKSPVKPNKPVNIALGLIFGLIMGVGLAFFIEYLDTSVKTIDDVERIFQAPVLGVIPQNIGYLIGRRGGKQTCRGLSCVAHQPALFPPQRKIQHHRHRQRRRWRRQVHHDHQSCHRVCPGRQPRADCGFRLAPSDPAQIVQGAEQSRPDQLSAQAEHRLGSGPVHSRAATWISWPAANLPNSSMGILGSAQMKEMIAELKQRYDFIFFDSPAHSGRERRLRSGQRSGLGHASHSIPPLSAADDHPRQADD